MYISGRGGRTTIELDEQTLGFTVISDGERWTWAKGFSPCLVMAKDNRPVCFSQAPYIRHITVENGVGRGIRSRYEGLPGIPAFETYVWVEDASQDVYFEWIPLEESGEQSGEGQRERQEAGGKPDMLPDVASPNPFISQETVVKCVLWPGPMAFETRSGSWYTLLNEGQGLLIPNSWQTETGKLHFEGMFLTAGSYMPWYGQVRGNAAPDTSAGDEMMIADSEAAGDKDTFSGPAYIAIAMTPWNGRVCVQHPAGGPYTHVWTQWDPSLGRMQDRRIMRYSFRRKADYNDLCAIYRNYVFEQGLAATLREKSARLPSLQKLVGAQWVHMGIKTHVDPLSDFFDPEDPDKNNRLVTFEERRKDIEKLYKMGVKDVYLHLDGWADPGYDNCHPDYLPACRKAGGWEGLKKLTDSIHEWGYLIGLHDQYRDFYRAAPSFDEDYACIGADGTIPGHSRWAGGPQEFLSATEAVYYVRRNYEEVFSHDIHPDCSYLDVFTCNEGDECANPRHRMTRRDCLEEREKCFRWMTARGILPSSEEVSDWSMRSLVFCHYAPYSFQLEKADAPAKGVPLPLFNLVYHDCVIIPWIMDKQDQKHDNMLYALLNGGAPYLIRDGAYPNTDGSYEGGVRFTLAQLEERSSIVTELHRKVAFEKMTKHEFLGSLRVQRTTYSNGIRVTVDLDKDTYTIE